MKRYKPASPLCAVLCCVALLAASLMLSPSVSSQRVSSQRKDAFAQEVSRTFSRYDVLELEPARVLSEVRQTSELTLQTSEGTFDITLVPHDMRSENYRAVAVVEGGKERDIPRAATRTYKGEVRGREDTQARFTIDDGLVEGMILTRDRKYFVEPASRYSQEAGANDYLFYEEMAVIDGPALECAMPMSAKVDAEASRVQSSITGANVQAPPLSPKREAELATDADFEYFQALGSNAAAANNEILSVMNQVDAVYQAEIGLTFKVVFQRVFTTSADPYDASTLSGLLDQVRLQWRNAPPAGVPTRDLVHMWTGRDLDGFQTGLAYSNANGINGVVCRFQEVSVGVSERLVSVPQKYVVTAHEIGHNFGASHPEDAGRTECVLTIMSGIAQPNTAFTFCQFSRDEMTNYISTHGSCLANVTAATPTVQFSQGDYRQTEDGGKITVTVTRSSGDGAATVQYETVNQSANDRSDYTTALGTLRFGPGETSKSFNILVTDDVYGVNTKPSTDPTSEAAIETLQIVLSNPTNATLGAPSSATGSIINNDAVNGQNPASDPGFNNLFFVRQQYADFLNREGDAGGLNFWMGQLAECENRPAAERQGCRETRRINVSAAFFLSPEFQETGFFVIRVFRVGFGGRSDDASRRITYRPFIRDARQVGEGFIDGQPGSAQVLENNKQSYAQQIVADPGFVARFPTSQGAATFVDALYASAGVAPTGAERQAAINAFGGGGTDGRAAALRTVADSSSVRNAELRGAFVLLQYFGYMRRDADQSGYGFWLGKLNQFNGDFIAAEMVKAFITSGEYLQRFGP